MIGKLVPFAKENAIIVFHEVDERSLLVCSGECRELTPREAFDKKGDGVEL